MCIAVLLGALAATQAHAATDAWGGDTSITSTASGRFRLEQINGVWWLITPDGHGFFSAGVAGVRPEGDYAPALGTYPYWDAVTAKYGADAAWAAATFTRLQDLHVNTLGAWSRTNLFPDQIAYTTILQFSLRAPAVPGAPVGLTNLLIRDYFDPAYVTGATSEAGLAGTCAADPWCIGVFTDNEIGLLPGVAQTINYLDAYLLLAAGAPGKLALQAFVESRYADVAAFNTAWGTALASFTDIQALAALPADAVAFPARAVDRRRFDGAVAGQYSRVAHDALRAVAPDVLILGSRLLAFSTSREVVQALAPNVDALSVNYYELAPASLPIIQTVGAQYGYIPFTNLFDDLDEMYRLTGKPLLIGEFTYRAMDSGLPNTLPLFFSVHATQAERADAYGNYMRRVLARPFLVGAHWFKYTDEPASGRPDGENSNEGVVDINDDLWVTLTDRMRTVNQDAVARRLLIPGARGARTDCGLEWTATAPPAPPRGTRGPLARFSCTDGDPRCDVDAVAGQCTIDLAACAAIADARLPLCTPQMPTAATVKVGGSADAAALQTALSAALAQLSTPAAPVAGTCSNAVRVVIPLDGRPRRHRKLRAAATLPAGVDRDAVRLTCEAAP
ncbi:MAG: beta-galactosidase [Deltaproteobacteria bacterium]|nr:beta-galactosidase [Deltaproteobacteria bacterium]